MAHVTITSRLRNAHPDHRTIARGIAIGSLFLLLTKIAGAAKEMALAWRYGVSEIVDAYLYVLNLLSWPVAVWFAVVVVILVPLAASIRESAPEELPRFRAELLGVTMVFGLCLWLLAEIIFPIGLRSRLSGLSGTTLTYALDIAPILSFVLLLGIPISLFSAWMQSAGQHENTLLEGVPALVLLIILLMAGPIDPRTLVWGTIAGFACHLTILSIVLIKRELLERPRFGVRSYYWKAFWHGFGVMLAGQALMSFTTVVDQLFAARLGAGAISTLSYSNRILALILGLGATAVTRATLPVFSQAEAKGSGNVNRIAAHWVKLLLLTGAVAVVFGWFLAPWGVAVLFQRGAFTANNTRAVSEVFRYGLFQLPLFFPSLVLVSVISSRRQYGVLFVGGVIGLAAKLVSNALLVPFLGVNGLALASSLVYGSSSAFLFLVMWLSGREAIQNAKV